VVEEEEEEEEEETGEGGRKKESEEEEDEGGTVKNRVEIVRPASVCGLRRGVVKRRRQWTRQSSGRGVERTGLEDESVKDAWVRKQKKIKRERERAEDHWNAL
jgi:hypothetical protein